MIKKVGVLAILAVISLQSCVKETEYITVEKEVTAENEQIPLAETIANLGLKSGVIIEDDRVIFTSDDTIPRDVFLNFSKRERITINDGVTLTIDGIINAGKYQIFDLRGTGKVTGCPQIEATIPQWFGVDDTGNAPATAAFQTAIEAFPCVKKFVADGKFLADKQILLNQNNRYYDFTGATFVGPISGTGPIDGGLVGIFNRVNNIDGQSWSVENVTLNGGLYEPKNEHDNALGIGNARNIKISNVNIDGDEGLRGIAIQTPRNFAQWQGLSSNQDKINWWTNPVAENIIIENIIQIGGVNVMNIDIANGLAKNIIINNINANNIYKSNPQLVNGVPRGSEAAFRMSSSGDAHRVQNVSISNIILQDVYWGFNLVGLSASITNVSIDNFAYRGFNIQYPDVISLNKISLTSNNKSIYAGGSKGATGGILNGNVSQNPELKNVIKYNDVVLNGAYEYGIYSATYGSTFNNITLDGSFEKGIFEAKWALKNEFVEIPNRDSYYNNIFLKGTFTNCIEIQSKKITYDNVIVNAIFSNGYAIKNSAENSSFKNVSITSSDNTASHGAILNTRTARNCSYSGTIEGDYFAGVVNAGKYSTFDFDMIGSFSTGAIHTFGDPIDNTYESIYKANIKLIDVQSTYINKTRIGDTYELKVYDASQGKYILRDPFSEGL